MSLFLQILAAVKLILVIWKQIQDFTPTVGLPGQHQLDLPIPVMTEVQNSLAFLYQFLQKVDTYIY